MNQQFSAEKFLLCLDLAQFSNAVFLVFEMHRKQKIFITEIFMPHPIRHSNTTAWMLKHGILETEINQRGFAV